MDATRRERLTIDLRGLGAALRAHATTRELTVAAAARSVLAATLVAATSTAVAAPDGARDQAAAQRVKLTLRMRAGAAGLLSRRARAAGLSYGDYVDTLLDGVPAPAVTADHRQAVTTLRVSNELLASLSSDINALIRAASRGSAAEARQLRDLDILVDAVRRHLALSSRLTASLTTVAIVPRRGCVEPPDGARRLA